MLAFLSGMLLAGSAVNAQISDHLYDQLPEYIKPADRNHITSREKRNFIFNAGRYASIEDTATISELDGIVSSLEKDFPQADKKTQASTLICIAEYLCTFRHIGSRKGEWAPYDYRVLKMAEKDTSLYLYASAAHNGLAAWYSNAENYEESIRHCFAALDFAKKIKDSASIRASYSSLVTSYAFVGLYQQAMVYDRLCFQYVTAKEKQNGAAEIFRIDDLGYWSDLFLARYVEEHNPAYADSALAYINKIPRTGLHADWWNELYHYAIGRYYYELGNYDAAIHHLDSSLIAEDYYRDAHAVKEAIKGICLLKTGRLEEGKKLLINNSSIAEDYGLAKAVFKALYEEEKKRGNTSAALSYYEQYAAYADSAAELSQRGKVFEIGQRYNIRQKQTELDHLALVNVAQKKQQAAIIYGGIALMLLLLSVIAILYALAKKRQLTGMKAQQALKDEQVKMEQFLQRQDNQIRLERDAAVMEQRKKISRDLHDGLSGTLAALKYYINDIRLHRRNPSEQKMLLDIEGEVSTIYGQVRDYMHKLYHGTEEQDIDLNIFLQDLAAQFSGNTGAFRIKVVINEKEIAERLDTHRQTQLYFIIKEGITNAIKYAGSATITIAISFQEALCAFRISDNGVGMPPKITKGLGLNSIADRVHALNGRFNIKTARHGTSLEGIFPVN